MKLLTDSGQFTQAGVVSAFVLFWAVTFFLLLRRKPKARVFLVFFFTVFLYVGFTVNQFWPFSAWKLWSFVLNKETTYYSLTIGDDQGNVIGYDNHAAPPILPTQVNDLSRKLLDPAQETNAHRLGAFLLERANSYRLKLLNGENHSPLLGLPAREFAVDWTTDQMSHTGPFTEIIARKIRVDFGPSHTSKPVFTVLEEKRFK